MTSKPPTDAAETLAFADAAAFDTWLADHAGLQAGVWLKMAKKGSGVASLTSDEAVDVGLCHGWISGQRRPLDATCYLQKYVPRRARSRWSQVNVEKVEALTTAGRMAPAGLAEVAAAKADGRWASAYEPQSRAEAPPELEAALAGDARAAGAFSGLSRTARYAMILDIVTARTDATRAARLAKVMAALRGRSGEG
ncbi:YdeI family protein [Phenylobacterium sp.]|uniref:YdeI/OmpD-associated family protein n=1 Tax=Phenylobacterium sp. TaxID=1871053 RepID=UPI002734E3B4|nr:YdeI/OmpD-associated family protein [Phenylobacterium sp.]MDP3852527.1 YdeI/OmpD-associated family protein [Phenylobacterium sp.]